MALVSSISPSTADVRTCLDKRLPKGIHIVEADKEAASRVGGMSESGEDTPWGYLYIQHYAAENFDKKLEARTFGDDFVPRCFIHRIADYKRKANGKGIRKEEKPSISGLVFLQGRTKELKAFLAKYFPQYYLVNNCMTGKPASIPDSIMKPFMRVMETEPERIKFLRDPFIKFAKEHVKLRILTGILAGQEGYVVRINRDRNLVMDFGGYAVAISNVHNEDFEEIE